MGDLIRENGELIKSIADTLDAAKLENLTEAELKQVAIAVMGDELKKQLAERVKAHRIDINERVETFLREYKSDNTRAIYQRAISHFFDYLSGRSLNPLFVKALEADKYVTFLNGSDLSASSRRLFIAGISSFYSHLERWDDIEKNPFRGSKRPTKETPDKAVPSPEELFVIFSTLTRDLTAIGRGAHNKRKRASMLICAIHVMSTYGLRAGALPTLKIDKQGNYTGHSKGKPIKGIFDTETLTLLNTHNRSRVPFPDLSESRVRVAMMQVTGELKKQGFIKEQYSPHSLRHFFAVTEYSKNKDIYRLKELLNHASIQVTENYLKSMKLV